MLFALQYFSFFLLSYQSSIFFQRTLRLNMIGVVQSLFYFLFHIFHTANLGFEWHHL